MGPCALLDLVGADVHVHASEALYEKLREPRMAPPARLVRMLQAGRIGAADGRGGAHSRPQAGRVVLHLLAPSAATPTVRAWRCARSAAAHCLRASATARGGGRAATRPSASSAS